MAAFSELIKNFNKIRDFMRDFYIYGFKSRGDFKSKSPRTYDNEKRRIEGYLGDYIKWTYGNGGKKTMISLDSSKISQNPLYAAWKSKSFTANDIMLHFYLLDILRNGDAFSVEELTDFISQKSEKIFDAQTVRLKCVEYANEGILTAEKRGRRVEYSVSRTYFENLAAEFPLLSDAVIFFTEAAPMGAVGSFILDNENMENQIFSFKHHYIVHTLEDGILFDILSAIRKSAAIRIENVSEKTKATTFFEAVPLKIFVSSSTGRRYVCTYTLRRNRFTCYRLDYIKSVSLLGNYQDAGNLREKLAKNLHMIWGVGFGGRARSEVLSMKLFIDEESERYIIDRILREGRGGRLSRIDNNMFLYTKECFEASEMSPWIKTFTGRILSLESTNEEIVKRFYGDISYMHTMYGEDS